MDLRDNIKIHNKIAKKYEKVHVEIYNDIEQSRLASSLKDAKSCIDFDGTIKALDLGCGAGNLTKHLLDLKCEVLAADTSQGFLDLVKNTFAGKTIDTFLLNGEDLNGIKSNSINFVTTYSVLHHIPDYLRAVEEMVRVCAPGGIIYIDHEHSPDYWESDENYSIFLSKATKINIRKYFSLTNYTSKLIRLFINPKYANEGDIHVWKDDHINWQDIDEILEKNGASMVHKSDFLAFSKNYHEDIYEEYKHKCSDMRVAFYKKSP